MPAKAGTHASFHKCDGLDERNRDQGAGRPHRRPPPPLQVRAAL